MKNFKKVLDLLMLVALFVLVLTGIIKFPELQRFFGFIFVYVSASTISFVHDWSGIISAVLIIIHVFLNFKKIAIIAFAIIGLLVLAGLIFNITKGYQPIKLSSIEVSDYNGEKLGSINDIRENSIKGPQYIDEDSYGLEINGLISNPDSYSYVDILKLQHYQKVVTLNCVEGWSVKALWEGVLIKDLLKNIVINPGAKTIIFYAVDGYSTSFPIEYILDNDIMMAYKVNDVVLPAERGFPFQLVAEQKWGYKWIKWITKIELSDDINYKGYWEQRGYDNNGNKG